MKLVNSNLSGLQATLDLPIAWNHRLAQTDIVADNTLNRYDSLLVNGWDVIFNHSAFTIGECQENAAILHLCHLGRSIEYSTGFDIDIHDGIVTEVGAHSREPSMTGFSQGCCDAFIRSVRLLV